MTHLRVKKAYWVGSSREVKQSDNKNCKIVLVNCIDEKGDRNQARLSYFIDMSKSLKSLRYMDVVALRRPEMDLFSFEGRELPASVIEKTILTRDWREQMKFFVKSNPERLVRIYLCKESGEKVYWMKDDSSYTHMLAFAKEFPIDSAWELIYSRGFEEGLKLELVDRVLEKKKERTLWWYLNPLNWF